MQCRFGGHTKEFYSVAQHSVRVAKLLPEDLAFAGLMHDATEAYVQDLVRPIKRNKMMEEYVALEARVWAVIAFKYNLPLVLPDEVHVADERVLKSELQQLVECGHIEWTTPWFDKFDPAPLIDECWNPAKGKALFLTSFLELAARKTDNSFRSH
jgi:hypothetical protein